MSDTVARNAPPDNLMPIGAGAGYVWRFRQVTEALAEATTPHDVAQVVVSAAVPALGAFAGRLLLFTPDGSALETAAVLNLSERLAERFQRVDTAFPAPTTDAIRTGEPVALSSRAELRERYPGMVSYFDEIGGEAVYAVPLTIGERRLGALVCVWAEPRTSGAEEHVFIAALAQQCAQALDRARLLEAERRARHRAERLQALTAALSAAVTSEAVSRVSLQEGMRALGAAAGGVVLVTPDGRHQDLVALGGVSEEAVSQRSWWRFPLDAPYPVNDAVRRRTIVLMGSIEEFESRYPEVAPTVREAGYQAYAAAPLEVEGRVLGAINYNFPTRRSFDPDDVALVRAVAQQCAQALERARLYEAERRARADAEAANKAKAEFLANMSHELRTPLNAIAGYADLLDLGIHGPVTDEQRGALRRIQRSQKHLLSLINEVLNYARLEAGAVRYDIGPVVVADVLAAVEPFLLPQVRAKGLELAVADCDRSLVALADAEKVSQVLLNLLSNAVKFTAAGGRIAIACRARGSAADAGGATGSGDGRSFVEIAVTDTGIGIPPDQIERVFEPFVQIGRTLSSSVEGTGLGLSISRDLARAMGGELAAESAPGVGSTFTLTLPAA